MPNLLIRGARLVPLRTGDLAPDHPVDVRVADGEVVEVGLALDQARRRDGD